ncbi:hypothetical protein DRN44_09685 [Thermococci archaeon]|nr:MAG: hypothetical protein DRN44_09685 [Thermococci archaeon]
MMFIFNLRDGTFPFKEGEEVVIGIDDRRLIIEKHPNVIMKFTNTTPSTKSMMPTEIVMVAILGLRLIAVKR